MKTIGSRAEVMHNKALRTSGGLTKKNLKYNKQGRIVSKKQSANMKDKNKNPLMLANKLQTKKGVFGPLNSKKNVKYNGKSKKKSKKSKKNQKSLVNHLLSYF